MLTIFDGKNRQIEGKSALNYQGNKLSRIFLDIFLPEKKRKIFYKNATFSRCFFLDFCVPEHDDSSCISVTIDRSRMTSTEDRVRNTYRCPGWPIRLTEDEIAQAGTSRDSILLFLKFLRVFCFLTGSDSRNVNKLSRIFPETRIFIKKNLQKGKYAVSSQYVNKLSRIFVCLDRSFFYSFFWFFDGILIDLTGWLVRNKLVSTWPESNNGIEYLRKDTNVRPFKESHF